MKLSLTAAVDASMHVRALVAAAVILLATNGAAVAQMKCTVNDPTGTPLNVRSKPNGPIVGAFYNGTRVNLWKLVYVGNKPWARIEPIGPGKSGWVFRNYLNCQPLYD